MESECSFSEMFHPETLSRFKFRAVDFILSFLHEVERIRRY